MVVGQTADVPNVMEPTLASFGRITAQAIRWDDLGFAAKRENLTFDENENLELRIELGQTRLPRAEAAELRKGSVVPLDGAASAPVSLFVGDQLIGRGEPLWLNGKLAFRVVELFDNAEGPACH